MKLSRTMTFLTAAALLSGALLLFAGCEKEKVKENIHTIVTDTNTTTTENSIVGTWVACGYTSKSMTIPNCFDAWYPEDGLIDTLVFQTNGTLQHNWGNNHQITYRQLNDSTLQLIDNTMQHTDELRMRFLGNGHEMVIFRFRQYGLAAVMSNTRFRKINSEKPSQWITEVILPNCIYDIIEKEKLVVINSQKEYGSLFTGCSGEKPNIDFQKQTLLISWGVSTQCILKKTISLEKKEDNYVLNIQIRQGDCTSIETWNAFIVTEKINSNVSLSINNVI